MLIFDIKEIE